MVYATQVGMYNIQKFHLKLAIMLLNGADHLNISPII